MSTEVGVAIIFVLMFFEILAIGFVIWLIALGVRALIRKVKRWSAS